MKYNVFNSIISWSIKKRVSHINSFIKEPIETQFNVLKNIIQKSKKTNWGKQYNYAKIHNYSDFKTHVPIQTYEDIVPYIQDIKKGNENFFRQTT